MSRRNRSRAAKPQATAPTPEPAANFGGFGGFGRSGFDGANHSTRRGFIYFPTLETRREVDTYSRLELTRRARWLKRNTGFARRCINGIANMVGALQPRALTSDRKWNAAAEKLFRARANSPDLFDLSGRFGVEAYQPLLTRSRLCDGDILSVFTSQFGGAAVMTYEGHQVDSRTLDPAQGWRDGVQVNSNQRQVAFSVITDPESGASVQIPASAAVLHADHDSFGWQRAPSALHHAVNNLLDTTEIVSDLKLGIKAANRIGYYEFTPQGATQTVPGVGSAVAANLSRAKTPKGNNVLLEDAFRGGKIPQLDAGKEIRTLLDQRPHPNSMAFLEHLNRDIAAGLEMSSDVLWNIAKLGGASVRYVLADAQTTIDRHQQLLVDQFLTKFWIYFCAVEMAAGRLEKCEDPQWWLVGWLPPQKLTVDIARDGKLAIDLHRAGMLTLRRWYGAQGLDDEEEDRQRVEEYARRILLCQEVEARYRAEGKNITIDPERVFPTAIPGAAPFQEDDTRTSTETDALFSDSEPWSRCEGKLDDLLARFAA